MKLDTFGEILKKIINCSDDQHNNKSTFFLKYIKDILKDGSECNIVNMTKLTILFEGFFRAVSPDSKLKKDLNEARINRWANHFGTPTITFLIEYQQQIEATFEIFNKLNDVNIENLESSALPWTVIKESGENDYNNHLKININAVNQIKIPEEEKTGEFVKTYNPSGGFTTTACDPYSIKFIEYAATIAKEGGKVLEIGAAFGAATLKALSQGVTVYCNDIEPKNLAVIRNRYIRDNKDSCNSLTGDENKLILVPGAFPDELEGLPKASFDAILVCRVLHFFPGNKIEKALSLMNNLLKPGGKLFVVCETPFLKNWQAFIPEHEKRILAGVEWPGEINNPAEYESSGRSASLPKFVHWISKEILDRALKKTGYFVSDLSYINRKGQFPNDLVLDGKESVGVVGIRQISSIH